MEEFKSHFNWNSLTDTEVIEFILENNIREIADNLYKRNITKCVYPTDRIMEIRSQTFGLKDFPAEIVYMICDNLDYRDVVSLMRADENLEYLSCRKNYWKQYYEYLACLYDLRYEDVVYLDIFQIAKLEDVKLYDKIRKDKFPFPASNKLRGNINEDIYSLFEKSGDCRYKYFLNSFYTKRIETAYFSKGRNRILTSEDLKYGGLNVLELYIKHKDIPKHLFEYSIIHGDMDIFKYCLNNSITNICNIVVRNPYSVERSNAQINHAHSKYYHCSHFGDSFQSAIKLATKYDRSNMVDILMLSAFPNFPIFT